MFISDAFRVEKPVKVSFTAPELSNLGGLSLVAKSDKESGLTEKFASLILEWRNEILLVHSLPQLIRQRVYQIAAGFEDADDQPKRYVGENGSRPLCRQGSFPSYLNDSHGDDIRHVAIDVLVGTVALLFFVPVLFCLFERLDERIRS